MAGTNQAANLGGMLSQIGGSIRAGVSQENIDRLGGNIERMSKPDLDMNDPESIKRNAQWYHDTGKDREALALGERAATMQKEQAAQENISNAMGMFSQAEKNVNLGRVEDLDANVAGIRQAAAAATNAQTQLQMHQMANQVAAKRGDALQNQLNVNLANLNKMDTILGDQEATSKLDPRAVAAMKQAREAIYAKPQVADAYDTQKLKKVQQTAATTTAQATVDNANIRKQHGQLVATGDKNALAKFEQSVRDAGNGDVLDAMTMEKARAESFQLELAQNKANAERKAIVPTTLKELVNALPDVEQTKGIRAAFKGLEADVKTFNENKGTTSGDDVYKGQTLKDIESRANMLFNAASNVSISKSVQDSSELKGWRKEARDAQVAIEQISIPQDAIKNQAKVLLGKDGKFLGVFGTDASDDIYGTNVEIEVGGQMQSMSAYEAARLQLREEKAAGYRATIANANANINRLSGSGASIEQQLADAIAAAKAAKGDAQ